MWQPFFQPRGGLDNEIMGELDFNICEALSTQTKINSHFSKWKS
jgi:hypothetical protein